MRRQFVEKAEIYKAAIDYCEGKTTLAAMIDGLPVARVMTEDFINSAYEALIDAGQMDTTRFEWGESIRYTPSEVREILLASLKELKEGTGYE